MKTKFLAAAAALLVVTGCETMFEPIMLQREVIFDEQGLYVYGDLEESFEGDRYWNFWASNSNAFPVCVGLTLSADSRTSGHAFDGIHLVGPGAMVGVGYVYEPASFAVESDIWTPDDSGNC